MLRILLNRPTGFFQFMFQLHPSFISDTIESCDSISLEGMGVRLFCRPYALVGIPFSSSNSLDVLLSSDENRYDSSHMTAFSERLCCSSEIASWINQPFSFSHPFPGWLNGYIRLRLECRVWSSQGIILLDAIGVFKPLKCESILGFFIPSTSSKLSCHTG